MGIRFTLVIVSFGLVFLFILFNLFELQILKNQNFLAKAESQYFASEKLKAARGAIYFTDKDRSHFPLVINKDFETIYAVPKEIEDSKEAANLLTGILNIPAPEIERKLSKSKDPYELLLKKAPKEIAKEVKSLKIPGLYVKTEPERFYPFNSLASQLVGFVGVSGDDRAEAGRYGLEKYYNGLLSGQDGEAKDGKIILPKSGQDLNLTIDPNLQREVQRILNRLVSNHKATGGTVIVQDPQTGKILALESNPGFNPNTYGKFSLETFLNPAIQSIYEPGSVFKVITMAAGIDSGKITPETTYVDTGLLRVSGKEIRNWDLKTYGKVTMTNVLEKSINTGAAFAERQIGHGLFKDYLEGFGFGDKTGLDFPGELGGYLRRLGLKSPEIAFATASFGQGVAVTPIEMINAFSAIANGGELMRPLLTSEVEPKAIRRVISREAARLTSEMMMSALDKAEIGKINSYQLAGKTGTAQVPDFKKGGYTDKVINTYIGFGPLSNPRFTILIKLNEPEGAPLAGTTVVPAFRDLAQFILNYYNIPPDRL